jgi:hypothetical protein
MRGKIWHVDLDDSSASVPDAKGMRMLAELLRGPDVGIHAGNSRLLLTASRGDEGTARNLSAEDLER